MKKRKFDEIERVINGLQINIPGSTITSSHILVWNTSNLPYEELQDALSLIADTKHIPKDFDFYCKAHGGDSIGWQLTLHIKELEKL